MLRQLVFRRGTLDQIVLNARDKRIATVSRRPVTSGGPFAQQKRRREGLTLWTVNFWHWVGCRHGLSSVVPWSKA